MSFAIRKSKFAGVKLLVAIDVGTTFTAASYCLLDRKGNPLKLQEVGPYLFTDSMLQLFLSFVLS